MYPRFPIRQAEEFVGFVVADDLAALGTPPIAYLAEGVGGRRSLPDPLGHKVGQKAKTCGFSRLFCPSVPIARYGPVGVFVSNMLDVRAFWALGQLHSLARWGFHRPCREQLFSYS
jgi:hypothetical protein